jgi:hypothetical protein
VISGPRACARLRRAHMKQCLLRWCVRHLILPQVSDGLAVVFRFDSDTGTGTARRFVSSAAAFPSCCS